MKKMKVARSLFLLFACKSCIWMAQAVPGVTITPVADLTLQKLKTLYPKEKTAVAYQHLSLEGTKNSSQSCPRIHQLLFNEPVDILRQEGDELLVRVPNCFYLAGNQKKSEYWTHKSNVCSCETLKKRGLSTAKLPPAISFQNKKRKKIWNNTITLLLPFYDKKNRRTFSVGTRFALAKKGFDDRFLLVWGLNPTGTKFEKIKIPKNICLSCKNYTNQEKRKLFVKLLKKWSNYPSENFVPYVWGGCSFSQLYTDKNICCKPNKLSKKAGDTFQQKKQGIAAGFDCSGAILRAAQAAEIPYFFKNSSTIFRNLKPIKKYSDLQNGDLLYTPGHIMMISDLKKNKIVEARSHWNGFGKLLETKLKDGFQDITNFKQFFAQNMAGKRFCRIDKEGKVSGKARSYTFLKLPV